MFRPEFVKSQPKGLVSDGLTSWLSSDSNALEYNLDINEASNTLYQLTIPKYASYLCEDILLKNKQFIEKSYERLKKFEVNTMTDPEPLVIDLHEKGINIRYIGLIRQLLKEKDILGKGNSKMSEFLLDLMILRSIKNLWRKKIKHKFSKKASSCNAACVAVSLSVLNKLLKNERGTSESKFWDSLNDQIKMMFGDVLSNEEKLTLPHKMKKMWVILKFCQLVGIVIKPKQLELILGEDFQFEFTEPDLEFQPKLKYPPLVDYNVGLYYLQMANESKSVFAKQSYLSNAIQKFRRCRASSPTNLDFSYYYAFSMFKSHILNPTEETDLKFIAVAFSDYIEFLKQNDPAELKAQIFLNYITVVIWLCQDQLFHNKLSYLVPLYAPKHKEIFTSQFVSGLIQNESQVCDEFLDELKLWHRDPASNRVITTLFSLFPVSTSVKCNTILGERADSFIRSKFFVEAKRINEAEFNKYTIQFADNIKNQIRQQWMIDCLKLFYQLSPSLPLLYYLFEYTFVTDKECISGWEDHIVEEPFSWWFYVQLLISKDLKIHVILESSILINAMQLYQMEI
eukprot:TRINITY_DN152_c0_g1_i1.p1 TRINITY_DN152_c0_g1~~TRINITY_DN152_c0_g1_i1.p1  ORF type:complete len:569 (+),score=120.44 TRINITY_DN152_c0_g1_i1:1086-2792(+)